ncbi:MAG: metalloregulator ArsR/SmtB family transcription factor [Desulfobacteraceae bacterium]|nr:metalloregulator ArsR/SmtB family transcription factor [Desulfobacteraceae bacterium]
MEIIKRFKAISDPTRLRLFFILQQYELNVNEIVSIIGMVQSGISRHLKILLESGLLSSRRDGSFVYYSVNRNQKNIPLMDMVTDELKDQEICIKDISNSEDIIAVRKNQTKKFFKNVAEKWDSLKREVLGDFELTGVIKEQLNLGKTITDLGCGTGELIQRMHRIGTTLIGIDSSPEMLDQARKRLAGIENVNLRLGELEHLPMKNSETDMVILNMVLNHIVGPARAIQEIHRVMAQEGYFIIADFEKHNQEHIRSLLGGAWLGFEKQQVATWLDEAGFSLESTESYAINLGLSINVFISKKQK